jgi:hypothetical protein
MGQVKAVEYPELSSYVDVLVFSTQGSQSLASMLGGGGALSYLTYS